MRLPALALLALLAAAPAAAGPGTESAPAAPAPRDVLAEGRAALASGIDFLLDAQNADGSFGHHVQESPYMIWAPVPGGHRAFRAATTALALMALRRSPRTDERIETARRKGLLWLLDHGRVKRSMGAEIYAVWAYVYGLSCLSRYAVEPVEGVPVERVRKVAATLVAALGVYQCVDGGWGYFDFAAKTFHPSDESMSFVTATGLLALHEARAAGIEVPDRTVRRAVASLTRSRTPEGTYVYSFGWRYYPEVGINRAQGSLTRKPGCDLALHLFGAGPDEAELERGVANLLAKRAFARMALRRPVPHESFCQVSGYFYLFGYMNAAEVCRRLPEKVVDRYRAGLVREILVTRHPDGSFWDYPLYGYHKPYGTAYATLALSTLLPLAEPASER